MGKEEGHGHQGKKKSYANSNVDVAGSSTVCIYMYIYFLHLYVYFLGLQSGSPNFCLLCIYYSWRGLKCQFVGFSVFCFFWLFFCGLGFFFGFVFFNLQSSFEQVLTAADGITKNPKRPDSLCSAFFMLI